MCQLIKSFEMLRNKRKLYRRWISSKDLLNNSDAEHFLQAYTKAIKKTKAMIRKSKRDFRRNLLALSYNVTRSYSDQILR